MITIKDVARRAGVSPGTVSNALTGKRPVSEKTRRRIVQVIEELGYKPNLLARSLVNRRSHSIAVVTSEVEYYVPSRVLNGIDEQAEQLGYSLLLTLVRDPSRPDVGELLANLTSRGVDGIIWAVHQVGENRRWFDAERLSTLPPIVFLAMAPRPGLCVISTDNRAGARLAVEHLLAQGRRVIGHITGPLDWWEARQRRDGWRETLAEAGLDPGDALAVEGDWGAASGEIGLRSLWQRRPDLDAVFVGNDQMAIGALQAAHRLGLRIPEDLALVGFDNIPISRYLWPPLTTVQQRLLDLGRTATSELHRAIEARKAAGSPAAPEANGENGSRHISIRPELIVRESSLPRRDLEVVSGAGGVDVVQ